MNEKSCGVIVRCSEKYLLLHYAEGHWDLPKGHVEEGESEHETALRELKEETGIDDVQFIPGYREVIRYNLTGKGNIISKEVVFFLATTNNENVHLSHEHIDYAWLPYKEAVEKVTYKSAKELLQKAELFQ